MSSTLQRSDSTPHQLLNDLYGYADFRGEQEAVIDAVLDGRDALVLMPTGGGKSLCYQLPAIMRKGVGLVVSPLIALMQDQVAALRLLGVRAAYLNSSLTPSEEREVIADIRSGALDLVYIAPERLLQGHTLDLLKTAPVALIAIDEAHCVSQWGHDFRADYLGLNVLGEHFPGVPRLALTATADERTRQEILERLELDDPRVFISGFDRPNIRYSVETKTNARQQLLQLLARHPDEAGIVYCMSRNKVDSTAEWLCQQGYRALPYHAGMSAEERKHHQERFLREDGIIIVATIAFGMGIDKPDVRFVAHMDLPKSIEAYYQETGRAGRDGEPAEAWMTYGLQDVVRLRQMLEEGNAAEERKREERARLDALLAWCEIITCRRQALLAYFDDQLDQPCGNCDTCLSPPETWDATEAAQKLLSCIYRSGQRFGAVHIIDILRGKDNDKIRQHGHHRLSTHGIGEDLDIATWRSVIRQLSVQGYIRSEPERFNALMLNEKARPLLKGAEELKLRKDIVKPKTKKTPRASREVVNLSPQEQRLFEALRDLRKRLADEQGVPPYVVFHDRTLVEMSRARPHDKAALLEIGGVGQTKLDRYGEEIIATIMEKHPPLAD